MINGLFIIGVTLFIGMALGIVAFIGFCKIYWFLRDLKEPTKRKIMNKIDKLYRKIESL